MLIKKPFKKGNGGIVAPYYKAAGGGAAYTGPGDVVSGAYAWYGLRGYNAAYATGSNPALDIVDQAGANQLTVNILSNGRLDVASISSWVTTNSVSTIKVKRIYDQSGNVRHVNQATLANMPVLNLTGFGSLPAIVFTAANSHNLESSLTVTQAQPITVSMVEKHTANTGDITSNAVTPLAFNTNIRLFAGSGADFAASVNTWHAVQAVANNTSSAGYVDGSSTTGLTAGTNAPSGNTISIGKAVVSNAFDGSLAEAGYWPSGFNGTQAGDMNTNQHGVNGHNF